MRALAILKNLALTLLLTLAASGVVNANLASGPQNLGLDVYQAQSLLEPAPRLGWSGSSYDAAPESSVVTRGGLSSSANFAQRTFREGFSAAGRRELSAIAGQPIRTVDDLANAIRGGLDPSKIPVNVIERGGNTLILNTRTVQALERAGVPRSSFNVINRSGDEFFEGLLSGQLQRNNLTGRGISSVVPE